MSIIDVGVRDSGFLNTTRDDIYNRVAAQLKAAFGSQFDTSQESPDGQFIAVTADLAKQLLDIIEEAYYSYSPSHTYGQGLTNIVDLNRVKRFINTPTKVTVQLTGNTGAVVPKDSEVGTESGYIFKTVEEVVIPFSVTAICTTTGEVVVGPNEVTKIITPITGWDGVDNANSGITGVTYETDPQLRARREKSTILINGGPMDGIYEGLIALGLEFVTIIENDTASDLQGQPSGTFQVVVDGGAESEIAKVISVNKALGMRTFGNTSVTINDSKGYPKVINFSRSIPATIFAEIDIKRLKGSSNDAAATVKDVVTKYIDGRNIGETIYWSEVIGEITNKTDLISVRRLEMGRSAGAISADDLAVLRNEKPKASSSGIIVNELP